MATNDAAWLRLLAAFEAYREARSGYDALDVIFDLADHHALKLEVVERDG